MPNWKGIVGRGFRPQEFKDYVATLSFSGWRPQFAVVHNTSSPTLAQWHSHPGEVRMRNLESYYRDQKGWSAGPHLFIADDLIWVFTPLTTSGVHSPSWNAISWGVEMVGDYDVEPFNPGVRENTVDALAILHLWRGIDPDTLRFHKEDPRTTHTNCPGRKVNKADLISRVRDRMTGSDQGEHVPEDAYLPSTTEELFETPPATSKTRDGTGSSSTSGLKGKRMILDADTERIEARETLKARRDGKSLGAATEAGQVRTKTSNVWKVRQEGYCWRARNLPTAELIENSPGFGEAKSDFKGEASYFGKFDSEDEGTGSPAFGVVQTNSSVFGVALPKEVLIERGLAKGTGNSFKATPAGLKALVEVYYPPKRRLARIPVVDVGPAARTRRPADLAVATMAFLQDEPEIKAKGYKLKNVQVEIRIISSSPRG